MSIRILPHLLRFGNQLFKYCYPVYRPLYFTWKALTERRERAFLRGVIRPGMTVLDVGANIGFYTGYFSKLVGESGRVVAFEPEPVNFARLKGIVGHRANVSLFEGAVGDRWGSISLFVSEDLNVDHQTYDNGGGRRKISVPVTSLDDYVEAGRQVDFIKIDVQGFEYQVLQGAKRVIAENPDVGIFMEFWPHGLRASGVEPMDLVAEAEAMGLTVQVFDEGKLSAFNAGLNLSDDPDYYINLFLKH
jgi:FkbM family methyltransferase